MTPDRVLLYSFIVLMVGIALTTFLGRARRLAGYLALLTTIVAALGFWSVGIRVLLHGPIESPVYAQVLPIGSKFFFHVDALGAIFMMLVSFVAVLVTMYSIHYMLSYRNDDLRRYYPFLILLFSGLVAIVTAWDLFMLFLAWEFMSLSSYLLVVFEKGSPVTLRAGIKYFVMSFAATALMFISGTILSRVGGGSFGFDAMRLGMERLAGHPMQHFVLALFFLGFATKAGLFPMGDWLPDAHPAAPSGVSAMLSGVMIKMGVYGMIRVFIWMLPISHASLLWGGIIAGAGALSLFVGTLTALVQTDAKRLLAFHSIGQMGYICLGLGMAIAFMTISPPIAAVALMAALYHMVNHACFKSLLFLNAGSILHRTGTRDLNHLGGLGKFMPLTAFTALIASLAISGIPPLNGFASKWMLYQVTVTGGMDVPMYAVFGLVALFISVATLASFVKFLGTSFWGSWPGQEPPQALRDVPFTMQFPQVVLAVACVGLGLVPVAAIRLLFHATQALGPAGYWPTFASLFNAPSAGAGHWQGLTLNMGEGMVSVWSPLIYLVALAAVLFITHEIFRMGRAPARITTPWYSGEHHTNPEVYVPAHSYYMPFKDFLRMRIGRYRLSGVYPHIPLPRLRDPAELRRALDLDNRIYYPIIRWGERLLGVLDRVRETQLAIPQAYVLWLVAGAVVAIVLLFSLP